MSFHEITKKFSSLTQPGEILLKEGVHGFEGSSKSPFVCAFFENSSQSVIVVFKNSDEAEHFFIEAKNFLGEPDSAVYFDIEDSMSRSNSLARLSSNKKVLFIASLKALLKGTYSKSDYLKKVIRLEKGQSMPFSLLSEKIIDAGYERAYMAEEEGDVSFRGGIIDIVSERQGPVRIEFSFDEIESIRQYDTITQRSTKSLDSIEIIPVKEDGSALALEYFNTKTVVFIDEPEQFEMPKAFANEFKKIYLSRFAYCDNSRPIDIALPEEFGSRFEDLLKNLRQSEPGTFIVTKQQMRVKEILSENDLLTKATILQGELNRGFILKEKNLAVYSDRELYGEILPKRRFKQPKEKLASQALYVDFSVGEPVVHKNHGIGVYEGIEAQTVEGIRSDYLFIRYAGQDKLYVPIDQMHLISRYGFSDVHSIKLNRLGGRDWQLAKSKAKKSIKDMTKELLEIYSERKVMKRPSFMPDSTWQREFESAFVYEETPDQLEAIDLIKKDMESDKPMDRLLCGDVGYGKTEVALRSAFKAVSSGKQVSILVPTTILAEQHYKTFKERFAPFPFVVEMLSRFRTKTEQAQIIEKIKLGGIDIVIGTHRLLQKDVSFKDLGLLIVDEEQRFGVAHKERIKKLKNTVDCLTMTATPIPRTLYMSLSGIWDMSIITTPPPGRTQIATYVLPWSREVVKGAIEKELERGGQIFYLHNRVDTIFATAEKIKKLLPQSRISVAHGQMKETDLEKAMSEFIEGRSDLLVCTAIIESGLDIPNANTIIIEDPQNFGLSALYQLKGRVGRSTVKANAYLMYNKGQLLTEKALDRLSAIKSFTKLGSGQVIAMKDLEIRGAGNVLGAQQHGHMMAIGFDLYCDMLKDTALEIRGQKTPARKETVIDIKIDAFIPSEYINDEKERIAVYRRMNLASSKEELKRLGEELRDRFGRFPKELDNLFTLIKIKIEASSRGILKIARKTDSMIIEEKSKTESFKIQSCKQEDILSELLKAVISR